MVAQTNNFASPLSQTGKSKKSKQAKQTAAINRKRSNASAGVRKQADTAAASTAHPARQLHDSQHALSAGRSRSRLAWRRMRGAAVNPPRK